MSEIISQLSGISAIRGKNDLRARLKEVTRAIESDIAYMVKNLLCNCCQRGQRAARLFQRQRDEINRSEGSRYAYLQDKTVIKLIQMGEEFFEGPDCDHHLRRLIDERFELLARLN